MFSIFKIFKKKRIVPHIRLSGIIGSVGRFKQGINFSGQQEIIDKAFSIKKALAIALSINSPGGSVTSGMAIYDTMQFVEPEVGTICMGLGASMGQFLLCAGAEGKRFALPHARILMHQPLGGVRGDATDIAIQAEQMAFTKQILQQRIAEHTGQSIETIETDSDRDRWFTAEEASDYGIIDKVIVRRGEMH